MGILREAVDFSPILFRVLRDGGSVIVCLKRMEFIQRSAGLFCLLRSAEMHPQTTTTIGDWDKRTLDMNRYEKEDGYIFSTFRCFSIPTKDLAIAISLSRLSHES